MAEPRRVEKPGHAKDNATGPEAPRSVRLEMQKWQEAQERLREEERAQAQPKPPSFDYNSRRRTFHDLQSLTDAADAAVGVGSHLAMAADNAGGPSRHHTRSGSAVSPSEEKEAKSRVQVVDKRMHGRRGLPPKAWSFDTSRGSARQNSAFDRSNRASFGDRLASFATSVFSPFSRSTPREKRNARLDAEHRDYARRLSTQQPFSPEVVELRVKIEDQTGRPNPRRWTAVLRLRDGSLRKSAVEVPANYPFEGPEFFLEDCTVKFVLGVGQIQRQVSADESLPKLYHVSWTPAQNLLDAAIATVQLIEKLAREAGQSKPEAKEDTKEQKS